MGKNSGVRIQNAEERTKKAEERMDNRFILLTPDSVTPELLPMCDRTSGVPLSHISLESEDLFQLLDHVFNWTIQYLEQRSIP